MLHAIVIGILISFVWLIIREIYFTITGYDEDGIKIDDSYL